ncbi:hypothetical protein RXV86_12560 [Alisedimentitalea sp. MJ-SS2]|uniref:hypothetical protein n=1 Tax=Aliisedimentitalea sp. MJ-SS2 TaxID=3049795 RepID=UPI00290D2014|nr:hypothetical protein [Alisedimentitalea sp. MJ-SS2]MDU8928221.1 hypothetical protein [Alisedimentitalea sp. MJ-SS2]
MAVSISQAEADNEIFRNPDLGIAFYAPEEWDIELVDASDTYVRADVGPADKRGFCGIHSFTTDVKSVAEIADRMTEALAAELEKDGILQTEIERNNITTASGVAGVRVSVLMNDDGWSKRAYFLHKGVAHMVDCETTLRDRDEFKPAFDTVHSTFDID